ncbi:sulfatase [Tamlana fucoidanivorans]|uniref:Sulfatase n=1 Tax=Allotamlana fucoidanivorans TaxID=2583814 RepID=A0A5C4SR33_9FLAO|nr:sulfatase [Tamlana fucoidanivorans]TNJ46019.1 sulfatase [Tamlana fucoidanivorans]
MKTKSFLILSLLCYYLAFSQEKPNIIWVFSDDHSYQTIGAYGGRLQNLNPTPNLDKLASEGMIFNKCYVENSICAPSRATLLTGKMSHLNGKFTNSKKHPFDHNQQQFQKILQKNGYQTAMIGKIHLRGNMQGFDYWEVLLGQGSYVDPVLLSDKGRKEYKGYTTNIITDKSLDWLENKRDKNKPFMMMLHHKAPHRPWVPDSAHINMYENVEIPEPINLFDNYNTRTTAAHRQKMSILKHMNMHIDLKMTKADEKASLKVPKEIDNRFDKRREKFKDLNLKDKELLRLKYQIYMKDYLRCIWSLDKNIGRILTYLKKTGLDKNTIIMYSSDQGFYMGEHGWFDKRFMYEESFRTPLIVKWPGKTKAGSVNSDLVQNIDFAETFLEIAGAPIPEDMQGKSLVPILKGKTPKDWRKSLYYHYYEYPGAHSVRRHEGIANKRFKLIRFYGKDVPNGEEWEFYNLKKDPSEMNNLYLKLKNSNKISKMKKELLKLKELYKIEKPLP